MAEKFAAKIPEEFELELTTLDGEVRTINIGVPANAKSISSVLRVMAKMESDRTKELEKKDDEIDAEKQIAAAEFIATELNLIYPGEKDWFLENFDIQTLQQILIHVSMTLGGYRKKSSN